jgi:hypothetical protein
MADVMEVNAITGNVVVRDMTDSEVEQRTKDLAEAKVHADAKAAKAAARQALLEKLGITEEEAQLLLGGI